MGKLNVGHSMFILPLQSVARPIGGRHPIQTLIDSLTYLRGFVIRVVAYLLPLAFSPYGQCTDTANKARETTTAGPTSPVAMRSSS